MALTVGGRGEGRLMGVWPSENWGRLEKRAGDYTPPNSPCPTNTHVTRRLGLNGGCLLGMGRGLTGSNIAQHQSWATAHNTTHSRCAIRTIGIDLKVVVRAVLQGTQKIAVFFVSLNPHPAGHH